jgi:hypothetical protein
MWKALFTPSCPASCLGERAERPHGAAGVSVERGDWCVS